MTQHLCFLCPFVLCLASLSGCDLFPAPEGGPGELCADGRARGSSDLELSQIAALTPSPEGVAVCPDGDVFVTLDGLDEVWRVPLDGAAPAPYAAVPGVQPAGITCDAQGRLFVAGFSRRDGAARPPVLMLDREGGPAAALPIPAHIPASAFNGIVAASGLGVFVSDTLAGQVLLARELSDGSFETRVVLDNVLGANGLAYDPAARRLYLALSFLPAQVRSYRVARDGSLSDRRVEWDGGLLTVADGVAVDAAGEVYVADYLGGAVLRARDNRRVAELSVPASLAFRGGNLLITQYHLGDTSAEGGLYSLSLGRCGPGR